LNASIGGSSPKGTFPIGHASMRELGPPRVEKGSSQMPKMKTKSGAKKRFKMTGTGKVKAAAQGKRHGMIKRHAKFIRQARGTMVLNESDAKIVKKYMPYAR
jgi:large subunit ribosomal protein L35